MNSRSSDWASAVIRAISLLGLLVLPGSAVEPTVATDSGRVRGRTLNLADGGPATAFLGIPYAAAPTGSRRWKAPAPVEPWRGIRDSGHYGPWCEQAAASVPPEGISEDCLYINVWTPGDIRTNRMPVLVFIHGGGFAGASASHPYYRFGALLRQGLVIVSFNYRLGVLGFLAHPELSRESPHRSSGNYALLDQIAALRWTKRNIAKFGGDSEQITIMGDSAGAHAVACLLASPLSQGLFQRAVLNGPAMVVYPKPHFRELQRTGEAIFGRSVQELRAATPAELRKRLPPTGLNALKYAGFGPEMSFSPVVDGWVLPINPPEFSTKVQSRRTPVMVGAAVHEGDEWVLRNTFSMSDVSYKAYLGFRYGSHASDILKRYPAIPSRPLKTTISDLITDSIFLLSARGIADSLARSGSPVFVYLFSYVSAHNRKRHRRAAHSNQIPYLFGTVEQLDPVEQADRDLSR
ncbi:MAG TPA: carboxylesterase family protein, partial [Bryobacteraceae bacterium]|nr:carboxylesterase family protein [Bryobacteraceae bacterium]